MTMEHLEKDEIGNKLLRILKEITECESFEDNFVEKLVTIIHKEISNRSFSISSTQECIKWLCELLQKWAVKSPNVSEAIIISQFVGVLLTAKQGFSNLQNNGVFSILYNVLQPLVTEEKALIPAYMRLLSNILNHNGGYEWIKSSQQWKIVCKLYFSNSNLYVEREGQNFLNGFIQKASSNEEIIEEVFREIFSPVIKYEETNTLDKNFFSYTKLLFKLLESILWTAISYEKNCICSVLVKVFDIEKFLSFLLTTHQEEDILVAASKVKILFFVANSVEKKEDLGISLSVPQVLDIFCALLKQNQFNVIIRFSNYCQGLLNKLDCELQWNNHSKVDFVVLQLLAVFICVKPPDTAACDFYIQKVFSLCSSGAPKFGYLLRDEIKRQTVSKLKDIALMGILTVATNTGSLKLEEAVIIFQAMVYILKPFIENSFLGEAFRNSKCERERSLSIEDTHLFLAVLNVLCTFIEKFKINWSESLESLCLLKVACIILQAVDLDSIVIVQVLLLVKLSILNFMSPDLALLLNNTKDSAFDCLMPLLHKRLHDPKWEVRDSCLEVVTAIAELSESKYPAFQQLLVENNFYSLIVDIMEGDSESYVRASAIQALTAMAKIETLSQLLYKMELPRKVIKLLQKESEGIVRRDAALLVKQIYLTINNPQDEMVNALYEIMGYLAICDLHWEVKVNSLVFWEAVIQRTMGDQGMIDGSFPNVTFSKEHKKIVYLTEKEIKIRLDKVLMTLSNIGCLHVLLSTLNDDCDMPVIKKSGHIVSDLVNILKSYRVMESGKVFPISDRISMKRKFTVVNTFDKRKSPNLVVKNSSSSNSSNEVSNEKDLEGFIDAECSSSDVVIDGIVNENDINLLASVTAENADTFSHHKKVVLQQIQPEVFLLEMQDFDLEKFLEDKEKFQHVVDMFSFVEKPSTGDIFNETNIMDCY